MSEPGRGQLASRLGQWLDEKSNEAPDAEASPSGTKFSDRRFVRGAIARRSQRRTSRIAKGLRTRCYSPLALARIANGDGGHPT
jgi:hypothetical protein